MQSVFNTTVKDTLSLPALKHLKGAEAYWQKPQSWPDIRQNLIAGAGINLLICNAYANLGFKAACIGGYSVYVNGVKVGDYASAAACNLTLSELTGGFGISYPAEYTAHRIEIRPQDAGALITAFSLQRTATSGAEVQGLLWAHFALSNPIELMGAFIAYDKYSAPFLEAVTAQNGILNAANINTCLSSAYTTLKTFPLINAANITTTQMASFTGAQVKNFVIKNISSNVTSLAQSFYANAALRGIKYINCDFSGVISYAETHKDNRSLVSLPKYNYSSARDLTNFLTNAVNLQDTYLDISAAANLNKVGCYGTAAYPMRGLKGVKISSAAPFGGSAPQINLSYTGIEREGFVSLFSALPNVSGGQVCVITGASGASALTEADLAIATAKGWTVTI